ncbi:MAG: hypothetical protein B6D64_06175 [Bacteroidetes bacterium 4484_276]|nr:MAG: hypothetical protein B6D64_06175 [Bacteroidetes bacterium 4484_276]OYT14325.1 MAG: hypothetical protein B6I19_00540 [Bacteroidetes bacterium 4572_114]
MFTQRNQGIFDVSGQQPESLALSKTFLSSVFSWMFMGLLATAGMAWIFADNAYLMGLLYSETGMTALGWVVMLSPIGFVLLMSFGFQKLSSGTLMLLFIAYSVIMGMSLSFIFMAYELGSIASTFVIASGMFGAMAILGYTTKTDLSKFGSIMIMGLVGIIIASVVNMFLGSSTMDYIISFLGVLIFTGLTAYDVQKLKRIGSQVGTTSETSRKLIVMGALTLYLDFINLFLFLLRFLGNRR